MSIIGALAGWEHYRHQQRPRYGATVGAVVGFVAGLILPVFVLLR